MATGVVHGFKATVDNIKSNLAKGNHPDTGVISGILRDCCNKAQVSIEGVGRSHPMPSVVVAEACLCPRRFSARTLAVRSSMRSAPKGSPPAGGTLAPTGLRAALRPQ